MGPFGKGGSRTKITSLDTSAEDVRDEYNGAVSPVDIDRMEAPVTFKVAQVLDLRKEVQRSLSIGLSDVRFRCICGNALRL